MDNIDKTSRSIFVGNIPYNATEDDLTNLFRQTGDVVGFRLVHDRESGKSKGYGFCEYSTNEIAANALRNHKDIEYNGRALRIGSAVGEQSSVEVALTNNTSLKHPMESPYGEPVDAKEVGASINRAVASLPPEQLYDLMSQMKACIQNNPADSRQLLLDNPQLTYALLQAQMSMRIIEPNVAISMMMQTNDQTPQPVAPPPHMAPQQQQQAPPQFMPPTFFNNGGHRPPPHHFNAAQPNMPPQFRPHPSFQDFQR